MKNKKIFTGKLFLASVLMIIIYSNSFSQTKVGRNLYLYGQVTNSLRNKNIMVKSKTGNLPVRDVLISELKKKKCKVFTRGDVFMFQSNLNKKEKAITLDKHSISFIFLVEVEKKAVGNYHLSHTDANANVYNDEYSGISAYGEATTKSGNIQYLQGLRLGVSIFSSQNDFDVPVAKFVGVAGSLTKFSSVKSVSKKVIKRIIKYMRKEGLFKK